MATPIVLGTRGLPITIVASGGIPMTVAANGAGAPCVSVASGGIPVTLVGGILYVLDMLSVAASAAYSLRRLRNEYEGSSIRVRRSFDNTEQDIGFTASGDLDTVALLAFVQHGGPGPGNEDGFVTTWYDQSGNGRDAINATAANQPRIVDDGVVETVNGKPAVNQIVAGNWLDIPSFSGMTSAGVNAVYAQITTNNGSSPWRLRLDAFNEHLPFTDGSAYLGPFGSSRIKYGLWSSPANTLVVASVVQEATTSAAYRNGTQVGATASNNFAMPTAFRSIFGGTSGSAFVSEMIVLSAAPSTTDRQTLEQDQGAYYGITVA